MATKYQPLEAKLEVKIRGVVLAKLPVTWEQAEGIADCINQLKDNTDIPPHDKGEQVLASLITEIKR